MKFSILTPSFNSGRYLKRMITSVTAQTYGNWEHIVQDGFSTDDTKTILAANPQIDWISRPDSGQSEAMNSAFQRSTGDIIIYLNADDELRPDALENYHKCFQANPEIDMVVADLEIDHSGQKTLNRPSTDLQKILHYWPCVFPANPVSYAYTRTLQEKVGVFPAENHFTMDYWFLLRAILKGRVIQKDFTGGTFYFDGQNKSANADNSRLWLKIVRDDFLFRYFYYPQVGRFILRQLLSR
ncbi:glycosyltransferase [Mucilaginibacter sp.]|uniref:glycosyltransferase n=1 Tax=Mucilaginibacter sp. TaxID=1882438 RepID=UPI0035BC2730